MKIRCILFNVFMLLSTYSMYGQEDYQISKDWGLWQAVKNDSGVRVEISYKMSKDCDGYSYYRIYNNWVLEEGSSLEFGFYYLDCTSQIQEEIVDVILSKAGVDQDPGMWFSSNKLWGTHFRLIKYHDEGAERKKEEGKRTQDALEEQQRLAQKQKEDEQQLAQQQGEERQREAARQQTQQTLDNAKKINEQQQTLNNNNDKLRNNIENQQNSGNVSYTKAVVESGILQTEDSRVGLGVLGVAVIADLAKSSSSNKDVGELSDRQKRKLSETYCNDGQQFIIQGDYVNALNKYQMAADLGNSEAMYEVGWLYNAGLNGVQQNYDEAYKWLKMAAEQGVLFAMSSLGDLYCSHYNMYSEGMKWLILAFKKDNEYGGTVITTTAHYSKPEKLKEIYIALKNSDIWGSDNSYIKTLRKYFEDNVDYYGQ